MKDVQRFQISREGFLIEALLIRMGSDYLIAFKGGKAHIGAVAMAQPRPSLAEPSRTSSTSSVFCYVGHKEDELVKKVSEMMSAALEAKVVTVAGLHWDRLGTREIERIVRGVQCLAEEIIKRERKKGAHE